MQNVCNFNTYLFCVKKDYTYFFQCMCLKKKDFANAILKRKSLSKKRAKDTKTEPLEDLMSNIEREIDKIPKSVLKKF